MSCNGDHDPVLHSSEPDAVEHSEGSLGSDGSLAGEDGLDAEGSLAGEDGLDCDAGLGSEPPELPLESLARATLIVVNAGTA